MAVQSPFRVMFEDVFPLGLFAVGEVQPLNNFDASTADVKVQERDRDTGLPMWVIDAMDPDPNAREHSFKVKIISDRAPVLPDAGSGGPFIPVVLEGLMVVTYLKETGVDKRTGQMRYKVAYSLRATGVGPVKRATAEGPKAA